MAIKRGLKYTIFKAAKKREDASEKELVLTILKAFQMVGHREGLMT